MLDLTYSGGTVGRLIADAVTRFSDRPALADDHVRWTYSQLGDVIGRLLTLYRQLGLKPGDGICMVTGNRVEAWAATCASNVMGLRHTHLHPMSVEDDHAHILQDSQATTLIVDSRKFAGLGQRLKARLPQVQRLLSLGQVEGATDILARIEGLEAAPLVCPCDPEDTMLLTYTGGTTGKSKGIDMPHRAIVTMSSIIAAEWEWPQNLRYMAMTPISHSAGVKIYPVMSRGGYTRLVDGFDVESFCQIVAEEGISATFLVPTMLNAMLQRPKIVENYDLSSLGLIIYGAAPMAPDQMRRAIESFGPVFLQLYGQSEAPECITTMRVADHDLARPDRLASCGRATMLCEVTLLDTGLNEVPDGTPGELCVRGPLVMNGYWGLPELTEEVFRGGWLHTGDVAWRDSDGYYYIVDRTKDMIISGGFNIYPREVEDTLAAHPAVDMAAVIGVPDAKWGEAVTAFVVLRDGKRITPEELMAHVKAERGGPWAPKTIHFLDELPLTGLGKLDRKSLRKPYWEGRARDI
ncbi:AMP-binding protein [Antarcticimicrobium sediminis]|uniref:3-methylmercaptopropionyl-CoA ligase n=1 Tax=Antarcticimicrobium sediminis TaxID=2546227 RepID=A0A4R5EM72_9RHOB|nr:AMP-binding protein [Antarcticimicrobium sediminis]TDE35664.1 acyl-CoA synthetase [Antarcticimicrobium sediminis]